MVIRAEVKSGDNIEILDIYFTEAKDMEKAARKVLLAANSDYKNEKTISITKIESLDGKFI